MNIAEWVISGSGIESSLYRIAFEQDKTLWFFQPVRQAKDLKLVGSLWLQRGGHSGWSW